MYFRFSIAIVVFLVSWNAVRADQPPAEWMRFYNGPANKNDWGREIDLSSDGSVTVIGGTLPLNLQEDMAIVRYDTNGNELWSATYNGPANGVDRATGVAADDLGNAFMVGNLWNAAALNQDYVIVKYDSLGTLAWVRQFNGPGSRDDTAWDVRADGQGGAYIVGSSFIEPGTPFLAKHFHVAHHGSNGATLWEVNYDGPGRHGAEAYQLQIAPDGNLVVIGWIATNAATNNHALLILKITPAGQVRWAQQWEPSDGQFDPFRLPVRFDRLGNIYGMGYYYSDDPNNNLDAFVVKFSPDGVFQWSAGVHLFNPDSFNDLVDDEDGNIYVAGGWDTGSEFTDALVASFTSEGQLRWIRTFDEPNYSFDYQEAQAIMRGPDGLLYVGMDWQYPDAAGYDFTVRVMDNDGNTLDNWRYDTGSDSDTFFDYNGWRMDSAGNIYIGASSGVPGNADITTLKIATQPASLPGDINGNGVVGVDDVMAFVDVLSGMDTSPGRILAADLNNDGSTDGLDVHPFVQVLIGG